MEREAHSWGCLVFLRVPRTSAEALDGGNARKSRHDAVPDWVSLLLGGCRRFSEWSHSAKLMMWKMCSALGRWNGNPSSMRCCRSSRIRSRAPDSGLCKCICFYMEALTKRVILLRIEYSIGRNTSARISPSAGSGLAWAKGDRPWQLILFVLHSESICCLALSVRLHLENGRGVFRRKMCVKPRSFGFCSNGTGAERIPDSDMENCQPTFRSKFNIYYLAPKK